MQYFSKYSLLKLLFNNKDRYISKKYKILVKVPGVARLNKKNSNFKNINRFLNPLGKNGFPPKNISIN